MYLIDREKFGASTEAEAAPFTLESLIAWLRKQDADDPYSNCDTGKGLRGCVFARYAVHLGYSADFDGYCDLLKDWGSFPSDPYTEISCSGPFTMGGALARAEKLLALGRAPNSLPYGDL